MMDAKLVAKQNAEHKTTINIGKSCEIGGKRIIVIGGPCAVESAAQMETVASNLNATVHMIRGGVYKPRTSPYAFQGLRESGLDILAALRTKYNMPVITEVMSSEQIAAVAECADVLQIGSRNMQNFELLKALGGVARPVMLKRGLSATLEEMLMAAEYIASHGNSQIILCERGIRSFDPYTRNVLDLGAVAALKQITHLPVIVDPSHAAGKRELVADLARAAVACGADGLMIECHPEPEKSVSDARQALSLPEMIDLVESLRPVAQAIGRTIDKRAVPGMSSRVVHLRARVTASRRRRQYVK